MLTGFIAYDSTHIASIPSTAQVVICYSDGTFANEVEARARFPHAHILPLTARGGSAPGIDWEPGNTERDPVDWLEHASQPPHVFYADLSDMNGHILPRLNGAHVPRHAYKLLSAHPNGIVHICGPTTCGRLPVDADGTQYVFSPQGRDIDISILRSDFFGQPAPPVVHAKGTFRFQGVYDHDAQTVRVEGLPGDVKSWGNVDEVIHLQIGVSVGGKEPGKGVWTDNKVLGARPR